eukprot:gnl/TRDRNA2_/TRDRNA2_92118_c0_seq3.p1 gnl/TRDRNA2_/TRDRNA2_92118_c0~~gnl/TRDRNA2_/TRDRNA2_92118_c0_seq3.p1  ORF type:complete len:355 (+),score=53.29 gnl/TRDRNA2_/TRDRNA2_92118_c0_seq3:97-1065(+)
MVTDDGESRRQSRDKVSEVRQMSVDSAHTLEAAFAGVDGNETTVARCVLEQYGFCRMKFRSTVADELLSVQNPAVYRVDKDPESELSRQLRLTYQREAEQMVCEATGAKHCITLHHAVRFGKPNPKGVEYLTAYATFAHVDYTQSILASAPGMLVKRGVPQSEIANSDFAFFNVWQPVGQTVEQHPLALLDQSSVDQNQIRVMSLGYKVAPKRGDGNADIFNKSAPEQQQAPAIGQLVHSDAHRWYYYPQLTPDEALVFVQCDSRDHRRCCFHTAFWDESAPPDARRRQSIELHAICVFPKGSRMPASSHYAVAGAPTKSLL